MKGRQVGLKTTIEVVRVHILGPAFADLLGHGSANEIQPRLVEPVAECIGAGAPNHHRGEISQLFEKAIP
jgi:hypothetical protein